MALPSVMNAQHTFSRVPQANIQRSQFDRSHGHKTTFNAGYLVPFYIDEVLPGDTFNLHATIMARLSSTAITKPIMDNMYLETFFFFCPRRLIWTNFQKFMGEQANPGDSISFNEPQMTAPNFGAGGITTGSLSDQFGLPVGPLNAANPGITFNSCFHRMYNLTWNQWFRDENMQNSVTVDTGDGPDTYSNYVLLQRGKRHDYFTSCLTSPQKGTASPLPLGSVAPVKGLYNSSTAVTIAISGGQAINTLPADSLSMTATGTTYATSKSAVGTAAATAFNSTNANVYADLTNATAATINSLRQAITLQQFLEIDARGGTRYTEVVRAHFGVVSPDARLQRVEYLGGGQTPININPVAGTNNVGSGATAAGQLTAFGTAAGGGHGFVRSFTEHGLLMGLVCVRADLTYQQGMNRMFSRRTRYDHFWPIFANLGEQSVPTKEIYMQGVAGDDTVFGYQERYAEYRYKPSEICGTLRSNVSAGVTSLEAWHLSQNFGAAPTLVNSFIVENPPLSRIKAVTTEPDFIFDSYIRLICARPMPVFGVPGLTRL